MIFNSLEPITVRGYHRLFSYVLFAGALLGMERGKKSVGRVAKLSRGKRTKYIGYKVATIWRHVLPYGQCKEYKGFFALVPSKAKKIAKKTKYEFFRLRKQLRIVHIHVHSVNSTESLLCIAKQFMLLLSSPVHYVFGLAFGSVCT